MARARRYYPAAPPDPWKEWREEETLEQLERERVDLMMREWRANHLAMELVRHHIKADQAIAIALACWDLDPAAYMGRVMEKFRQQYTWHTKSARIWLCGDKHKCLKLQKGKDLLRPGGTYFGFAVQPHRRLR